MNLRGFFAIVALVFAANSSHAAGVTWNVDLEFEDNGTAQGSFVWDPDLNVASSWNIVVSAGLFSGNNAVPGDTFDSSSPGHDTDSFTLGGFSFIQFITEDVSYMPGPDRPRFLRFGLGLGGLDVLDTPVASLPLVPDTVNMFPFTITGFADCGSCSPFRNGKTDSTISAAAPISRVAPIPVPAGLPLLAGGLGAIALVRRFRKRHA